MNSLDPRVERLPSSNAIGEFPMPSHLDQLATFEVFVQPKEGKPFQHEGAVHAPDLAMAYVLAKETFTRRFTCISMFVAETKNIFISPYAGGDGEIWNLIASQSGEVSKEDFEIFFLTKRGRQHVHAGRLVAENHQRAMISSKDKFFSGMHVINLWVIRTADILFTPAHDSDLWTTLPEKKFRDAAEYKGGERLKNFIEQRSGSSFPAA